MSYNEADTRAKLIDPAIHAKGWTEDHIKREVSAGAIDVIGKKAKRRSKGRIDYTLRLKVNSDSQPVAIALIEAKKESLSPGFGLEQGKKYAEGKCNRLDIKFVFSSNGHIAGVPLVTNQQINTLVIKDDKSIDYEYLYYFIKHIREDLRRNASTSLVAIISKRKLESIPISFEDDINKQKAIAVKLKKQMTAIDEILRDIDRQITDVDAFVERQISDAICSSVGSDWTEGLVEEFAEVNPSVKGISKKPDDDDEVPFVPMPAVSAEEGRITEQIVKKYSEVRKGYTYFEEGDILFAKITPCMQNGKIAIAENLVSKIGFGSTEFHVIRVDEHLIPEWLFYHFRRKSYLMEAVGKMQGAVGQQRLPDAFIRKTQIAFPSSLDAQREIVKNLQGQVDRASELKHDLNKQKKNVIALREAYYRESFESEAQE